MKKLLVGTLVVGCLACFGSSPITSHASLDAGCEMSLSAFTANGVRIRTGPGTNYTAFGSMNKNDSAIYTRTGSAWTRIYSVKHKRYGYVYSAYLR